jgi:cysteine desulfurase
MHVPLAYAMGTLRFSVGKMTTQADIDGALDLVVQAVHRLRQASNAVLA